VYPRLLPWKKLDSPDARLAVHRQNLEILMIADPNNIDALAVHLQSTNTRRARVSRPLLSPGPNEKMHEYLPQVRVRGRVTGICGQKDRGAGSIMDKQESALQAIQPDARFHVIENAGHWVQYEAAQRFNELLLEALAAGGSSPQTAA
jgi:pimeloyl-ACP methyl ester carboxylesterase